MPFFMSSDDSSDSSSWITWYCSLDGNGFLVEIDDEFLVDPFSYNGLSSVITDYSKALSMIQDGELTEADLKNPEQHAIYKNAKNLYAMLHARYILSPRGLKIMKEKYLDNAFGVCPRVLCKQAPLLPVGLSDDLHIHRARLYCQRCQETYNRRDAIRPLDGANFGTSFPHIFIQTFTELLDCEPPIPYIPKIFGFRVWKNCGIIETKLQEGEYGDTNQSLSNSIALSDGMSSESTIND